MGSAVPEAEATKTLESVVNFRLVGEVSSVPAGKFLTVLVPFIMVTDPEAGSQTTLDPVVGADLESDAEVCTKLPVVSNSVYKSRGEICNSTLADGR